MNGDTTKVNRCEEVNKDGQPCRARAMKDSRFCFFHHPNTANQRAAARRAGGVQRSQRAAVLPADMPEWPLASPAEITRFLPFIVNRLIRGQIAPNIAYILSTLISAQLKALELSKIAARTAAVDAAFASAKDGRKDEEDHEGEKEEGEDEGGEKQ